MTTDNEWRTDRPEVGRVIRQPCGSLLHVSGDMHAHYIASGAVTHPAHLAWQYIDPSPEMVAAADLGTACAWIEVFARVVVPLGAPIDWQTGRPVLGRKIRQRDGWTREVHNEADADNIEYDAWGSPHTGAWTYIY